MSEDALTPDTQALLRRAKDAWTPSEDDRTRYERALVAATAVSGAAVITTTLATSSTATKNALLVGVAKASLGLVVLSATAFVAYGVGYREGIAARSAEMHIPAHERTTAPTFDRTQTAAPRQTSHERSEPAPSEPIGPQTPRRASAPSIARRPMPTSTAEVPDVEANAPLEQSGLAREVETLRRARVALEGGSSHLALEWLGRYRTEFPSGTLSREASILRIRVLCALDRRSEAAETLRLSGNDSLATDAFTSACRGRE